MKDLDAIIVSLNTTQKLALRPCSKNRQTLPKSLVTWRTRLGHRYPSLKLSNLGYKVRNRLYGI